MFTISQAKKLFTAFAITAALILPAHAEAKKKKSAHKTHIAQASKDKLKKKSARNREASPGYARASDYLKKGKQDKQNKKKKKKKNKKSKNKL